MTAYLLIVALASPTILLVSMILVVVALQRVQTTVNRMETAAQIVAVDLAATANDLRRAAVQRSTMGQTLDRMEAGDQVVAHNLADSVSRADATVGPEGAAADAALRTGDSAEAITERQNGDG